MTPDALAATHAEAFAGGEVWNAAAIESLLATPGTFAAGQPRAFALIRVILDEAEVPTLATHPEARRQGLARAALRQAEAEAARRGAARMFLEVAADNAAARALYEDCGYVESGRRKGYYRRPDGPAADALLFRKDFQTK